MGRVLKMWPMVIAVITLVYAVGKTTTTLATVEDRLGKNEACDSDQEKRITQNEEGRRALEKRLDRIEDKLDRILRAVK